MAAAAVRCSVEQAARGTEQVRHRGGCPWTAWSRQGHQPSSGQCSRTLKARLAAHSTPERRRSPAPWLQGTVSVSGPRPGPRVPPGCRHGLSSPCAGAGCWPRGWGGSMGGSPVGRVCWLMCPSLCPCSPQAGDPCDEVRPDPQPPPTASPVLLLPRCLSTGHPVPVSITSAAACHPLAPPATNSLQYWGAAPCMPPSPLPSPVDPVGQPMASSRR